MIHQLVKRVELNWEINQQLNLLKLYMPYCESDHVLNIAYNVITEHYGPKSNRYSVYRYRSPCRLAAMFVRAKWVVDYVRLGLPNVLVNSQADTL